MSEERVHEECADRRASSSGPLEMTKSECQRVDDLGVTL